MSEQTWQLAAFSLSQSQRLRLVAQAAPQIVRLIALRRSEDGNMADSPVGPRNAREFVAVGQGHLAAEGGLNGDSDRGDLSGDSDSAARDDLHPSNHSSAVEAMNDRISGRSRRRSIRGHHGDERAGSK